MIYLVEDDESIRELVVLSLIHIYSARRYMLAAGAFSLLLASFVCGCIHYILYLQRKLEEYKNKEDQKKDSSDS